MAGPTISCTNTKPSSWRKLIGCAILECWSGNPHHDGHHQLLLYQKKDISVRNISGSRELNKHRVRKPYPIPKMSTMGHLNLNMDYYTIRLDPAASKMCTIILPWGKHSYKRLPMGFGGSVNIFQAYMIDLMASLEYVWACKHDLLIITRGTLDDHPLKIKTVLTRLHDAGLKVNAAKSASVPMKLNILETYWPDMGSNPNQKRNRQYLRSTHLIMLRS